MSNNTDQILDEVLLELLPIKTHLVKPLGRFSQPDGNANKVDVNQRKREQAKQQIKKHFRSVEDIERATAPRKIRNDFDNAYETAKRDVRLDLNLGGSDNE